MLSDRSACHGLWVSILRSPTLEGAPPGESWSPVDSPPRWLSSSGSLWDHTASFEHFRRTCPPDRNKSLRTNEPSRADPFLASRPFKAAGARFQLRRACRPPSKATTDVLVTPAQIGPWSNSPALPVSTGFAPRCSPNHPDFSIALATVRPCLQA